MSNRRYGTVKELPYIWYEIDAVESWLDEQAQQGLRLTDIQGKLCVFQPSDEPPARCRVHVKPHNGYYTQQEEYKETMRELGWEYVGRINYRADVYRATRPDAVEINTDEDALRSLLRSNMWFDGIAAAALIALTVYSLWKKFAITRAYSGFYSLLLDDIIVTYLIPEVLLALILVLLAGAFLVRLARQRKRCLLGRDCRFDGVLRKRKRFYFVLLGLLMFAFPMLPTIFGVPEATESTSFDTCPVVLLQSLSPEEAEQIVVEDYDIPVRSNHYLLANDTIYRQSGPTVWLEGTGWGYTPLYYTVKVTDVHREDLAEILCGITRLPRRLAGGADQRLGSGGVPAAYQYAPGGVAQRQRQDPGGYHPAPPEPDDAAGQSRGRGKLYRRGRYVFPAEHPVRTADTLPHR